MKTFHCIKQQQRQQQQENFAGCPPIHDKILCWPPTRRNSLAILPCFNEYNGVFYNSEGTIWVKSSQYDEMTTTFCCFIILRCENSEKKLSKNENMSLKGAEIFGILIVFQIEFSSTLFSVKKIRQISFSFKCTRNCCISWLNGTLKTDKKLSLTRLFISQFFMHSTSLKSEARNFKTELECAQKRKKLAAPELIQFSASQFSTTFVVL